MLLFLLSMSSIVMRAQEVSALPAGAGVPGAALSLMAVERAADDFAGAAGVALPGSLRGVVKDSSGGTIAGAAVTLASDGVSGTRNTVSGDDGEFHFGGVPAGRYRVMVAMPGLDPWVGTGGLRVGEDLLLPEMAMLVAAENTVVEVSATTSEVAAAQLSFEEKQRVLGVFPNFYATYIPNAAPMTTKQKFSLAWKFAVDPVAFAMSGFIAGTEQAQNSFAGYGQGSQGYAKRFGATYGDGFNSTMIGQALLPAIFHQDPRYFVKGTGSIRSRAMYAIATTVMCKGDNGRWQVNYSNILGNVASAGISNLYYPATSRSGAGLTVETSLLTTASGAIGGLIQEFLLHKMTPNIPDYGAAAGR